MIDLAPLTRLGVLLVRPGALFLAAPLFGGGYAPPMLKIGLTVVVGAALVPGVPLPDGLGPAAIGAIAAREALIGLSLGFAVRILVGGAEFAGQLAGFQLGFAYASLVDPQTGVRNSILSALYGSMAIVVLFGLDLHHDLLRALVRSFEVLPVGAGGVDAGLSIVVTRLLGLVFVVGAQLAAPVVIVMLVVELALGLLARAAPTLNLMAQGFPVRLLVGLLALAAMIRVVPGVVASAVPGTIDLAVRAAAAFR